ncbi:MAG TPA: hypothetical protein VKA49_01595 [Flavitalea sp.]|nr:hypothetical protein [Flavitalea sp.]
MTENLTISKAKPPFTSMDFAALREIGITHFEKMGSKIWTDYNLHDPGITILEVLCYAITDLGYRTNFSIEDLLASSNNHPDQKQFFSALEILTCNPVTENDFRKVLIDVDGIKNAWLVKTAKQEVDLAVFEKDDKDKNGNPIKKWTVDYKGNAPTTAADVILNGLYDVYVDLDQNVDHNDLDRVNDIIQYAWRELWKHRNLCEDYVSIRVIEEMEFGIDLQVELCPDADVNKVAGDIYYYIQEFLTPTIQFYSFQEMYETRKKSCDEIFQGPVLCNGFIDDEELDKAQLRKEIYLSDLWQVVMDVCGVAGIRKLTIYKCDGAEIIDGNDVKKWCIQIPSYQKPRLSIDCSSLSFQKEYDCIFADDRKVLERIALLQKLNQPRMKSQERPPLEQGLDRNLEEYFTIQNEFPFTYKIAQGQITEEDTNLRKAQVRQLKGYLLLFDQLLANYLLSLARVKDLLSISQPEENTYFFETLYDIPGVRHLIKAAEIGDVVVPNAEDLKDEPDPYKKQQLKEKLLREREDELEKKWNEFIANKDNGYYTRLSVIIESETKRKERKNIFLDHLLARFGEVFTDYVTKVYEEQCNCTTSQEGYSIDDELLKDKAAFLRRIPELSSERGKGFNYKALDCGKPFVWDCINVAGLKKRVSMYLGFDDFNSKTLTCPPAFDIVPYRVITEGRVQAYRLRLQDKEGNILLDGLKDYRLQQNAVKDAKDLREQVLRGKIVLSPPDPNGYVRVYVRDREDNNALQSEVISSSEAEQLKVSIESLAFPDCCAIEGFHIVEHILLRPKDDDYDPLMDTVIVPDLLAKKVGGTAQDLVIADPYSFWITVAVPEWLPQFRDDENAQNRFEQLVRRECPAHIVVKFCWMSPKHMYQFESALLQWLYENALSEPNERELTEHVNDLVAIMKECDYTIRDIGNPCLGGENSIKKKRRH